MVVGFDNIDILLVKKYGVVVINIFYVLIEIIVELGFILMFIVVCRIIEVILYI